MAQPIIQIASAGLGRTTRLALAGALVVYPALYCAGFMGPIVSSIFEGSRQHWWQFWSINLLFHLVPFAGVAIALRKSGESWSSLGLDLGWLWRHRVILGLALGALMVGAWSLPTAYYGDSPPPVSGTHFLGPVSRWERLFVIFCSIVVGFTEEALFRGFALTRLKRIMPVGAALAISTVSFVFIHGTPRSPEGASSYVVASLLFAIPFIVMKCRRLELLILIHVFIDASLAIAP